MWLVAACGRYGRLAHGSIRCRAVGVASVLVPHIPDGGRICSCVAAPHWYVIVRRHLGNIERVRSLAATLTQPDAVAHVDWRTALQVGQGKRGLPITAISGAENREQCLILVDGQQLAVTKSPSLRREIPTDDLDFSQKWLGHTDLLLDPQLSGLRWKNSKQRK